MKILHTSDWHIGHMLYAKKRLGEHKQFLDWLAATIAERGIDALIVAGDIFDTGAPGAMAQGLYYDFLQAVSGTRCRDIVITAGNHDSPTFLAAPASLLRRFNIHVAALPEASPDAHVVTLRGPDGAPQALCCAVPYLRKNEMVRMADDGVSSDEKIVTATKAFYSDVAAAAVEKLQALGGHLPIIATGHLFASGAVRHDGDGVRDLYVGSLGQVGADIFPDTLAYVALGHIHSAQCVGGHAHIRYCGSPLAMSFSELGRKKHVLVVDTDHINSVEAVDVPVFQKMAALKGDYIKIMDGLAALRDDDVWIEVTYTGSEIMPNLPADVHAAVAGGRAEVLSIKNNAAVGRIISAMGEAQALDTLTVQDVFQKCLQAQAFSDKHTEELIACFNEIVDGLEGGASCA
jgi:exonuclease SbcD